MISDNNLLSVIRNKIYGIPNTLKIIGATAVLVGALFLYRHNYLSEKTKDLGNKKYEKGNEFFDKNDYENAKINFEDALSLFEEVGLEEDIAESSIMLGKTNYYNGNFYQSIQNFLNAEQNTSQEKLLTEIYTNILYFANENIEFLSQSGVEYFYEKAIQLNNTDSLKLASHNKNLGGFYFKLGQKKSNTSDKQKNASVIKAEKHIDKSLRLIDGIDSSLYSIDIPKDITNDSYKLLEKKIKEVVDIFILKGKISFYLGNNQEAIEYVEKAKKISGNLQSGNLKESLLLSEIFIDGDFEEGRFIESIKYLNNVISGSSFKDIGLYDEELINHIDNIFNVWMTHWQNYLLKHLSNSYSGIKEVKEYIDISHNPEIDNFFNQSEGNKHLQGLLNNYISIKNIKINSVEDCLLIVSELKNSNDENIKLFSSYLESILLQMKDKKSQIGDGNILEVATLMTKQLYFYQKVKEFISLFQITKGNQKIENENEKWGKDGELQSNVEELKDDLVLNNYLLVGAFVSSLLIGIFFFVNYKKNEEIKRLLSIVNKTDNAVLITDAKGRFLWVNSGYERLLGHDIKGLRSKSMHIIGPGTDEETKQKIEDCYQNKKTVEYETKYILENGKVLWLHATMTPILDKDGEIEHVVVVDSDITKRKEDELLLQQKNAEIEQKNTEIGNQKEQIEKKNIEINKSIDYATLMQSIRLTKQEEIDKVLNDNFLIYEPLHKVSGDFYHINQIPNGDICIIIGDSEGHGIPGAFISIDSINILEEVIYNDKKYETNKIADGLEKRLGQHFNGGPGHSVDIVILMYNPQEKTIEYTSAKRPIIRINKGEIIEYKDRESKHICMPGSEDFTRYSKDSFQVEVGDIIYLFSDGFPDQFINNIKKGKSTTLGSKRFKDFLLTICHLPLKEQEIKLKEYIKELQGDLEQTDDKTFFAFKIN